MSERKIFVTSDLHFSHEAVLKYNNRPWKNVLEMNDALIENWNRKVNKRDTVIIVVTLLGKDTVTFLMFSMERRSLLLVVMTKCLKNILIVFLMYT